MSRYFASLARRLAPVAAPVQRTAALFGEDKVQAEPPRQPAAADGVRVPDEFRVAIPSVPKRPGASPAAAAEGGGPIAAAPTNDVDARTDVTGPAAGQPLPALGARNRAHVSAAASAADGVQAAADSRAQAPPRPAVNAARPAAAGLPPVAPVRAPPDPARPVVPAPPAAAQAPPGVESVTARQASTDVASPAPRLKAARASAPMPAEQPHTPQRADAPAPAPRIDVHIGTVTLSVRGAAPVAAPALAAARREPAPREAPAFSAHRHYLRSP